MSGRTIVTLTFAAAAMLACDNEVLNVESRNAAGAIVAHARGGTQLPFRGSYTSETQGAFTPPSTLTINRTAAGHATQLGRFTATSVDIVDVTTATSTGTFTMTAANGDELFATTAGEEDQFIPPNVSHVTLVGTIVGGTGRFAAATGTFTIRYVGVIDFATGTSTESGSWEGNINLK